MSEIEQSKYIAAIDLGSNSFHMVITKEDANGNLSIVDKVREMVRLGAGLDAQGSLSITTQKLALECLDRFKQRLKMIPTERIRAVGTNTFRAAKNSADFLRHAEQALGHPISIISGHEEARLVYLGAAFDLSVSKQQRLVVDIGGGSTELIIGKEFKPFAMDSLYMGCVSLTQEFFPDGVITAIKMNKAERLVKRELETVLRKYRKIGWSEVVGTSGTIKAIDKLGRELGINQDWISSESLETIFEWLLSRKTSDCLNLVSDQRRPVFVGGFMILNTIFKELSIGKMEISEGALREGVAYELVGRLHDRDSRFAGVSALLDRFHPDMEQVQRVKNLCLIFLSQAEINWELTDSIDRKLLQWASDLHELGVAISYSHYHFHSAYIVENSDIDGFSRQVQKSLAFMLRNSRQKPEPFDKNWMSPELCLKIFRLTILLRLSITIFRGRFDVDLEEIYLEPSGNSLVVNVPTKWADAHPLTLFDLEMEKNYLSDLNFSLELKLT